eukprot:TRINITY_DN11317_c0_g1_i1.p1 TRINITY_DN11317_c0_g1~~TRINITY_DN11317_c0_g1_i1.p1  ORF type:complete len:109 (-),score=25.19 TRINITY_DN11317_c0_g1_i1:30-326(-)
MGELTFGVSKCLGGVVVYVLAVYNYDIFYSLFVGAGAVLLVMAGWLLTMSKEHDLTLISSQFNETIVPPYCSPRMQNRPLLSPVRAMQMGHFGVDTGF